jgi:hypothetical protein
MKKYFIDVTDQSGNFVHSLEIEPGSVTLPNGQGTIMAWIVTTKTPPKSSFQSLLNGSELISLQNGQSYGSFFGFNFDLETGATFQVKYKTLYNCKITSTPKIPEPKQNSNPKPNRPSIQGNPVEDQMNQDAIDMVNKQNQPKPNFP